MVTCAVDVLAAAAIAIAAATATVTVQLCLLLPLSLNNLLYSGYRYTVFLFCTIGMLPVVKGIDISLGLAIEIADLTGFLQEGYPLLNLL